MSSDLDKDRDPLPEMSFGSPSAATGEAIREAVAADLEKVVPRSLGTRLVHALVMAVIVGVLTIASFGPNAFTGSFAAPELLAVGALVAVGAVVLVGAAFWSRLEAVSRDGRALVVLGILAAWSIYLLTDAADADLSTALEGASLGCGLRSLGAGVLGGAAFMWVWRKADPWTPRVTGALIGTCAGVVASAHVGVVCSGAQHGGHLLVGHWLAVPLTALVGVLVSRRVLAP